MPGNHGELRHSLLLLWTSLCTMNCVTAADWPTFRHDQQRSGMTSESLDAQTLELAWSWQSPLPPAPAWPDAARWTRTRKSMVCGPCCELVTLPQERPAHAAARTSAVSNEAGLLERWLFHQNQVIDKNPDNSQEAALSADHDSIAIASLANR